MLYIYVGYKLSSASYTFLLKRYLFRKVSYEKLLLFQNFDPSTILKVAFHLFYEDSIKSV